MHSIFLGDQIDSLREERQSILAEAAERSDLKERMNDMISFLNEMPQAITEYSDTITRRLVEKITIFDEKIVVEMKSGLQMEVEAQMIVSGIVRTVIFTERLEIFYKISYNT